ncbi:unnamed protein product [Gongylonema pulchrum]|uniref:DUF1534 domain-containing protein n=1 Tax=Gongylonema pulchrum TaxID=637853 RepID=A0A183DP80_9BILA|nr:unnamed protein product [Gongylonema pulchrum]
MQNTYASSSALRIMAVSFPRYGVRTFFRNERPVEVSVSADDTNRRHASHGKCDTNRRHAWSRDEHLKVLSWNSGQQFVDYTPRPEASRKEAL